MLIDIINSLIGKSRTLISSLERTLGRVEALEKEAKYWKNRYYKFKEACETNVSVDLQYLLDKRSQNSETFMNTPSGELMHDDVIAATVKKQPVEKVESPYFRGMDMNITEEKKRFKSIESEKSAKLVVNSMQRPPKVKVDLRKSIGTISLSHKYRLTLDS